MKHTGILVVLISTCTTAWAQTTERVSVSSAGAQGNNQSIGGAVSADGRYVAFDSFASNLVASDANGARDVFVHDRQTGATTRVSVSSAGSEGDGASQIPSITPDGRYIAFHSAASNLVTGDTNAGDDVFVHDRHTGTTERVSLTAAGGQAGCCSSTNGSINIISPDGRFVVFKSSATDVVPGDTNGFDDIYLRDRQAETTVRISLTSTGGQPTGHCLWPTISADGQYVAFYTVAALVPQDTNALSDVYVCDVQAGTITRVSVSSTGVQGNDVSRFGVISADGRYVAFGSFAGNLAPGDTNGTADYFVHDRQAGTTERVSVGSAGQQGNALTFDTGAISADGRYAAFYSQANNWAAGDSGTGIDVFLRDRQTGGTELVSVRLTGTVGNDPIFPATPISITPDGRFVAFNTTVALLTDDTNAVRDVFVRDRGCPPPSIDDQPDPAMVFEGDPATLTVVAAGAAPIDFQWRKGGVNLNDGGSMSGSQTPTLSIDPVATSDVGSYDVIVTDACGSTTSAAVALTLLIPALDCNGNGSDDASDLAGEISADCDTNGTPDECDIITGFRADSAALYRCDEGGGLALDDYSGHDNVGSNGGVAYSPDTPFPRPGNRALVFSHEQDAITIRSDEPTNLHSFTALTLEAFIKPTTTTGRHTILWLADDNSFLLVRDGTLEFGFRFDGMLSNQHVLSVPAPPAGTWTHVAGTYDGMTAAIYLDGSLAASEEVGAGTIAQLFTTRDILRIGNDETAELVGFARDFRGKIDEVRIVARALDPAEILHDATHGLTPGDALDCNTNGSPDECDLGSGASLDCNQNGAPDECDPPLDTCTAFLGCISGPAAPYSAPECSRFDSDADADVDLLDFAELQDP